MSSCYGWTYAGGSHRRKSRSKNKRIRPSLLSRSIKRLNFEGIEEKRAWWRTAGRVGRILVGVILMLLSLVALSKEPALQAEVSNRVMGWWNKLKVQTGHATPLIEVNELSKELNSLENMAQDKNQPTWTQKPLALISDRGLFLLDQTGAVWPLPQEKLPGDFPVITGTRVREEPGEMGVILKVDLDLALVKRICATPYAQQLSEIRLGSREGVALFTRDGIKIYLRNNQTIARDLQRLGAVIGDIRVKRKKIELIDLRYNQQVMVRPKHRR